MQKTAEQTVKTLNKNMPLRRFKTALDVQVLEANSKQGGIVIAEGIPRNAKLVASLGHFPPPYPGVSAAITDCDIFVIVSCLPFKVRAQLFWNIVGKPRTEDNGVQAKQAYAGLEELFVLNGEKTEGFVNGRVCGAKITQLEDKCVANKHEPDTILSAHYTGAEKLSHMVLTYVFLSLAPPQTVVADAANTDSYLTHVLGSLRAVVNPLYKWQTWKQTWSFMWCFHS
jgi:hypothetical protein